MPEEKLNSLFEILHGMGSALLAYSGGVDSTFLLKALALSGIKALAVTSDSETMPPWDIEDALRMAPAISVPHRVIKTQEIENEDFLKNTPQRCFYCKDELFGRLRALARKEGLSYVIDGSNCDDLHDRRPGRKAGRMHDIRSPLIEAGFSKQEIREASRLLGLPTWGRPSSPCLASRFPYGTRITRDALRVVASAELLLRKLLPGELRVRHYGDTARIELTESAMARMLDPALRAHVAGELKSLGYRFVSLDLEGFKSGKMNTKEEL